MTIKGKRKGAEDTTLIEFERYIKDIWAFLPTPIAYISPLGVVLDSDSTLEEMLHCPKSALVGRLLEDFFANKEQFRKMQRETIEKGFVRSYLCNFGNKQNSIMPVSIATLARRSRKGEVIGYFAAFVDMSENKRVEKLLQNTASHQKRLLETARYLVESLDIQEVLTRIAKSARDIVGADGCSIYLLDADGKTLRPVVAIDPPYEDEILATLLNIDTSFTGKVIKEKQAMIFNDTVNNPLGHQIPGTPEEENEHVIASPFIVDGEIIGAMCLDREGCQFMDDDLVVCEVFATYAATALRNARTYHDLQEEGARRESVQRALEVEKGYLEQLFESAQEGIAMLDMRGSVQRINSEFNKIFGYTRKDASGRSIDDLITPPDHEAEARSITERAAKGQSISTEAVRRRKDGTLIDVSVLASPIVVNGKQVGIYAIYRDITARKKADNDLRESEERYRDLVEKAGAAILLVDRAGKFTFYNKRFAELLGYTSGEMRTKDLKSIVHPDDLDRVNNIREELLKGKVDTLKHEFKGIGKNGSIVYLECDATGLRDNGKVVGTRSYIWDVTQRTKTEEELKSSEERMKLLFEYAPDGYYINDLKGTFLDGNRAAEEMTGYKKQELIGKNFAKLKLLSSDQVPKYLALLARNAIGYPTGPDEFTLTRKDGSKTIVGIRTYPVRIEGKTVVLGIARDITEYKHTQEELRKSYERMQKVLEDTINALTSAVEKRDPYTAGHQHRVAVLADTIAERLNLPSDQKEGLHVAALVHDIGKINVPAGILNKPTSLSDAEFALVRDHVLVGYEILRTIEFPWDVAEIVLQHHERMNGTGYPSGTKGSAIMLEARILAVADVVESMMAHRPYRPALGREKAINELTKNKKNLYDTRVVNTCLKILKDRKFRF
ncbi:MAG: PAS domain S-box protein [candidate division WOR-3 bacterium]|nr:MAG: PAS domain S-box protein [candidate division WOR-3 bacterium]